MVYSVKSRRFDKYEAMRQGFDQLMDIEPVTIQQDHEYPEWIRNSAVCHIDGAGWSLRELSNSDRERLITNIRKAFPDMKRGGSGKPKEYDGKPKTMLFAMRRRIENDKILIFIHWERDWKRGRDRDIEAELLLFWKDKHNYTGYRAVLEAIENIVTITQPKSWLSYVEIALDTMVDILAQYVHRTTLLKKVRAREYFHHSGGYMKVKAGISASADNWYQGAETSQIQLHSHMMTNQVPDPVTHRHIYRLELRLREKKIETYGPNSIKTIVDNMKMIFGDNVLWRKPDHRKFKDGDAELLKEAPVAYWIQQCLQRGVKHRDARRNYCVQAEPIPYMIV